VAHSARLALRGLDKTFGSTKVLWGVDLIVEAGEVHGLAGQNGSGKSTLVKIITGVYAPDAGAALEIDGRRVHLPVRWPEVHAAGISVVHQDLGLLDQLTVADNVCIGGFPRQRLSHRISRQQQLELTSRALARIGSDIDPERLTGTLSAPERAEVAVARALRDHRKGEGVIIMDESTRAMAGTDLVRVHRVLRALAREGTSVILISHSLPELLEVTDRVTILRDGRVAGDRLATASLTEPEIARRMLGSDALAAEVGYRDSPADGSAVAPLAPAVVVDGLSGRRVRDLSFGVGPGEVVGVTGRPGSGYEDLPYLMTGAVRPAAGRLESGTASLDLTRASIADCRRAGLALVPERRGQHGLAVELSVRDNVTLPNLRRRGRRWFVGHAWQQAESDAAVQTFDIRPRDTSRVVKSLSGGNQQKVLLAKWLGSRPRVLVLHEPTQAVDVGARRDILLAIRRAANDGIAIVLVSGEPSDLCAVCDRIYVVSPGGHLQDATTRSPDDLLDHVYALSPIAPKAGS
jgi:ribose transport system ATP-binding protein